MPTQCDTKSHKPIPNLEQRIPREATVPVVITSVVSIPRESPTLYLEP